MASPTTAAPQLPAAPQFGPEPAPFIMEGLGLDLSTHQVSVQDNLVHARGTASFWEMYNFIAEGIDHELLLCRVLLDLMDRMHPRPWYSPMKYIRIVQNWLVRYAVNLINPDAPSLDDLESMPLLSLSSCELNDMYIGCWMFSGKIEYLHILAARTQVKLLELGRLAAKTPAETFMLENAAGNSTTISDPVVEYATCMTAIWVLQCLRRQYPAETEEVDGLLADIDRVKSCVKLDAYVGASRIN